MYKRQDDDEDDDESMGHMMLCMYDKVQRVKNKWYVLDVLLGGRAEAIRTALLTSVVGSVS